MGTWSLAPHVQGVRGHDPNERLVSIGNVTRPVPPAHRHRTRESAGVDEGTEPSDVPGGKDVAPLVGGRAHLVGPRSVQDVHHHVAVHLGSHGEDQSRRPHPAPRSRILAGDDLEPLAGTRDGVQVNRSAEQNRCALSDETLPHPVSLVDADPRPQAP